MSTFTCDDVPNPKCFFVVEISVSEPQRQASRQLWKHPSAWPSSRLCVSPPSKGAHRLFFSESWLKISTCSPHTQSVISSPESSENVFRCLSSETVLGTSLVWALACQKQCFVTWRVTVKSSHSIMILGLWSSCGGQIEHSGHSGNGCYWPSVETLENLGSICSFWKCHLCWLIFWQIIDYFCKNWGSYVWPQQRRQACVCETVTQLFCHLFQLS